MSQSDVWAFLEAYEVELEPRKECVKHSFQNILVKDLQRLSYSADAQDHEVVVARTADQGAEMKTLTERAAC